MKEFRGTFIVATAFVAAFMLFMYVCLGAPTNGSVIHAPKDEYKDLDGTTYFSESFTCTSAADGEFDDGGLTVYGFLDRLVVNPSTGLTPSPTANFDVHLRDRDGYDLLNGQGLNLGNTVTQAFGITMAYNWSSALDYNASSATHTYDPPHVMGQVTLEVDNMGNASSAIIRIHGRGHSYYE